MTGEVVKEQEVEQNEDTPNPESRQFSEAEQEAMAQGWVPKEEWKGPEDEWVTAKAFLKYGSLKSELSRTRSEASQKDKVIKSMKDYYLNVKEDAKKELEDSLKRQKREAIKQEDYAKAAEIDMQLDELKENLDRKFKKHDAEFEKVEQPVGPPPEFYEWNRKNQWYKMGTNDPLTQEADIMAVAFAQRNPNASYPQVLDYVTERIKKLYPEKFMNPNREKPAPVNEPGETTGDTKPKGKYKLSEAEKRAAEQFGMTYEAYAAKLQEFDKKKGWA